MDRESRKDPSVPNFYSVAIPGTEEKGALITLLFYRWGIFENSLKKNPQAPCISKREVSKDGTLGDFKARTYEEVANLARVVGSSIAQLNMITEIDPQIKQVPPAKLFGLYVPNCEEWLLCELGCYAYGYALVPIYNTMNVTAVESILIESELTVLLVHSSTLDSLLQVFDRDNSGVQLQLIILVGFEEIPEKVKNKKFKAKFILWDEFLKKGEKKVLPMTPAPIDSINVISYTSGTTGIPKGVIITHKNFVDIVVVTIHYADTFCDLKIKSFARHISYLPMAHLFEKTFVHAVYLCGGHIGLYSGDVKKILEDIQVFKPTFFVSVPRLFQRIHDKVMGTVSEAGGIKQWIFNQGLKTKISNIVKNGDYTHRLYDTIIFNKIQKLLGGNVQWMFVGSSGMDPMIVNRIKAFFGIPVMWGYALTECTAGASIQVLYDTDASQCGGPLPTLQFRIRSVPDLNYCADRKPIRGELLMRGVHVTPGYFKNKALTDEVLEDGWLHTGDIVEMLENGSIRIIDRIKLLFKLAQGEYISPTYIESIINGCPLIAQSFISGKPDEMCPVAIIVPDEERIKFWKNENGMADKTFEEICKTEKLRLAILEEIAQRSLESQLRGYEKVKAIHITHEPFTVENGLLTSTQKLRRHELTLRYGPHIDNLYNEIKI
ncbi:bifunctional AMP-binding [Babesia duncani]|uniref:Bifunctional AMP-binding n=1 Tax=Babesia duncani TaxID=323732 RepID=A0AAD9PMF8_9APIC|nr:bifunctional AMP-binding [Babesia duncani]